MTANTPIAFLGAHAAGDTAVQPTGGRGCQASASGSAVRGPEKGWGGHTPGGLERTRRGFEGPRRAQWACRQVGKAGF